MKNKIFKLVSIIVPLILLISFIGCENKNNEKVTNESNSVFPKEETNEKSDEKVNSESDSVSKEKEFNYEEEYYSYIKNDLIPKYGLSDINSMQGTFSDNWLTPKGILSAKIYDFDNDGIKELFLIRIEETSERVTNDNKNSEKYYFYANIYGLVDNNIQLLDEVLLSPYNEIPSPYNKSSILNFSSTESSDRGIFVNIV